MSHQPTEEQAEAIRRAASGGSIMLQAFAGCAKSSTLEMMAPQIREPALALAFNKKIALDIGQRLPGNFQAKTLNGLGHSAWAGFLGGRRLQLTEGKQGRLVTQVAKESRSRLNSDQWSWTRDLVGKAMQEGLLPHRFEGQGLIPDTDKEWTNLAFAAGIPADEHSLLVPLARDVLTRSVEMSLQGVISFDDQIYCPLLLGGRWPQFPVVMVDESQDLSPMNHLMIQRVLRPAGRLIVVGDSKQAIYAWRGASAESMKALRGLQEEWTDLPLTMTFRCPKGVVTRQQAHAKGFRAAEGNRAGVIEDWRGRPDGWNFNSIRDLATSHCEPPFGIAILCRNNAPLFSLAFKLLRRQIGVQMLGRDINRGLKALLHKLVEPDAKAEEIRMKLQEWEASEVSLALANGREAAAEAASDRAEALRAVLDSGAQDARQLEGLLDELFSRERGLVTLSSIHRAKGLEWDFVLHLDPWRLPSKFARRRGGTALEQEFNLNYIAETRTRNVLVLADLEDFEP